MLLRAGRCCLQNGALSESLFRSPWSQHGESQHEVGRATHSGAPFTTPTCGVPGGAYSRTGGRQYCWCRFCERLTAGSPDSFVPPLTDSEGESVGARGLSDAQLSVRALPICETLAGCLADNVAYVQTAHTAFNASAAPVALQLFWVCRQCHSLLLEARSATRIPRA